MDMVFLGLGYSARAVARRLALRGWRMAGTSTTAEGAARALESRVDGIVFDGTRPSADLAARLSTATHVLVSIAPGTDGDPALLHHGRDLAGNAPRLAWIGYLSTVGVYGDHDGAWVDEKSELRPVSARSRQRVAAEAGWLALGGPSGRTVTVLRLSGIYGPGQSAVDNVLAGTARRIIKPGQVFNRIHVEDIAGAVVASMDRIAPGQRSVYNITDDEPAPPQDVVAYAARLLDRPVPPDIPYAAAELSPMGRSFYGETKRVANARATAALGWRPRYPTYREGMTALARLTGFAAPPLRP